MPLLIIRVVVTTYRSIGRSTVLEVAVCDASEGFRPTDECVGGSGMAYLFSPNCVLLVHEREIRMGDQPNISSVIQRSSWSRVDRATHSEGDVAEEKSFGASVIRAR